LNDAGGGAVFLIFPFRDGGGRRPRIIKVYYKEVGKKSFVYKSFPGVQKSDNIIMIA
jgi:hypothetical protein